MGIVDRAGLPAERIAALDAELAGLATLGDVVPWGLRQDPPQLIVDVVKQDEYTHDVIVPWRGGLVLVFDTT